MFRDFANDILACTSQNFPSWRKGETEDQNDEIELPDRKLSPVTNAIETKKEEERSIDEQWDLKLEKEGRNQIELWRKEKSGIGPEPELIPYDKEDSTQGTIYADDNSIGETGKTVQEVKKKT